MEELGLSDAGTGGLALAVLGLLVREMLARFRSTSPEPPPNESKNDHSNLASLMQSLATTCETLLRLVELLSRRHEDSQTKLSTVLERLVKVEGKLDRLLDRPV